ncbi:MAG: hypothetical protein ACUZ8E_15815 [Candidatus Anammoxibacter sp.]
MAEIKVEDYLNGSVVIADTDLFDLTVDLGGGNFDSRRLPMAVLKLILLGVRRFKVSRVFGDFSVAALEKNLEIFVLPIGYELSKMTVKHENAWVGPGITAVEVEVGISGEFDRYVDPHNILQPVGNKIFSHNVLNKLEDFGITTSLKANIRSVGAFLDQLTAGTIDFYIYIDQIK